MPEVNAKLVKLVSLAPSTKRYRFAFVGQKGRSVLLVALGPIHIRDAHAAVKETGIKKVYQGYCFGENKQLIFELNSAPPSWLAPAIRDEIRRSAGLNIQVVCRQGDAPEEPAEPDSSSTSAPAPNDVGQAYGQAMPASAPQHLSAG